MKRRKVKNKILIGLFKLSIVLVLLSGMALDSDSIIPLIVCGVSTVYIAIFLIANTRG